MRAKENDAKPLSAGPTSSTTTVPNGVAELLKASSIRTLTPDTPLTACPTSLDLSTPRGRAAAFSAANPGDYEFTPEGRVVITATDWLIMPDEGEDPENGEVHQFYRVVLFDRDGRFFRTTASFAPRRILAAVSLYPPEEWREGVTFVIQRRPSKTPNRTYHDIRILIDAEPTAKR